MAPSVSGAGLGAAPADDQGIALRRGTPGPRLAYLNDVLTTVDVARAEVRRRITELGGYDEEEIDKFLTGSRSSLEDCHVWLHNDDIDTYKELRTRDPDAKFTAENSSWADMEAVRAFIAQEVEEQDRGQGRGQGRGHGRGQGWGQGRGQGRGQGWGQGRGRKRRPPLSSHGLLLRVHNPNMAPSGDSGRFYGRWRDRPMTREDGPSAPPDSDSDDNDPGFYGTYDVGTSAQHSLLRLSPTTGKLICPNCGHPPDRPYEVCRRQAVVPEAPHMWCNGFFCVLCGTRRACACYHYWHIRGYVFDPNNSGGGGGGGAASSSADNGGGSSGGEGDGNTGGSGGGSTGGGEGGVG